MTKSEIELPCISESLIRNDLPISISRKVRVRPHIAYYGDRHHSIESVFSLAALEAKLVAYAKDPTAAEKPFDVSTVPKISRAQAAQEAAREWVYVYAVCL